MFPAPGAGFPGTPGPGNRQAISAATILVDGTPTEEVAAANPQDGTVTVDRAGQNVFTANGLSAPSAVKLADINHDGTPDLIVAESGLNMVLIYAGQVGGGFGPEVTGGAGYAVGVDPVGLTVGDLAGDGSTDLIVANRGSNTVTILGSHGTGANWSLATINTLQAGTGPFKTIIADADDGNPNRDLVICDSGSADAYVYPISPAGRIEPAPATIVPIDKPVIDMEIGRYSHRPEADLVAITANSDLVTYIGGVFSPHPVRREIATGLPNPTAAFSLQVAATGDSDLMLANSAGQVALLQAGEDGLVLTGLSAPTGLSNVTAIAATETADGGIQIYEASGDTDAIAVFRFDLGEFALARATPRADLLSSIIGGDAAPLVVEMVPNGGAMLDLVGILWTGSNSADDRAPGSTAARGRSTGQGSSATGGSNQDGDLIQAASLAAEAEDLGAGETPVPWTRFVLGLDAALESFQGEVAALAVADSSENEVDRSTGRLLADQGNTAAADPAVRADEWSGRSILLRSPERATGGQPTLRSLPGFRSTSGGERTESSLGSPDLTTAALGSAVAVRLLISASPPKPPRPEPRKRPRTTPPGGSVAPWPEVLPPTSPHG